MGDEFWVPVESPELRETENIMFRMFGTVQPVLPVCSSTQTRLAPEQSLDSQAQNHQKGLSGHEMTLRGIHHANLVSPPSFEWELEPVRLPEQTETSFGDIEEMSSFV